MPTYKTYQLRAYATDAGYDRIDALMRQCAHLYNAALEERISGYQKTGQLISLYEQYGSLTEIRKADPLGYGAFSVTVSRGVLIRLDNAMKRFFARCKQGETPGFPRFRPSNRYKTLELKETTSSMVRAHGKRTHLKIKGLPTLTVRPTGLPSGDQLKTLSITRRHRRLYVNLTYVLESVELPETHQAVGIDLGITDRLVCSDGVVYPRRVINAEKIKRIQRRLSRCKKGSIRFKQHKRMLSNLHERERIRNRNACHRITTDIVQRNDVIVMEDLKITNMTQSAKGTRDKPGKQVKAKSGLNREINNQSWGLLQVQMAYKAEKAGRLFLKINPRHTSQSCSVCGMVDPSSRKGKRYGCTSCGQVMDADLNASINLLNRGLATLPGGNIPGAVASAA